MSLQIDWYNNLINVLEPQVDVLVQDLYNFLKETEQSLPGMNYSTICDATGKDELDDSVATGITMTLFSPWQLRFWDGNYIATVKGGNLVGGLGGDPIAYTPNVQVFIIQSAASTIVVTGGSALTQTEHDKLMTGLDVTVPSNTWDESRAPHSLAGSFGATDEWASAIDSDEIAAAVWDAAVDDHTTPDTMGEKQDTGGSGDPSLIADAVWDESAEDHDDDGTMGELQNDISSTCAAKPKVVPGG